MEDNLFISALRKPHRKALCRILLHPSKIRTPIARLKEGDLVLDLEQNILEDNIAIWGEICLWEDLPNDDCNISVNYPPENNEQYTLHSDDVEEILRQCNTQDKHDAIVYIGMNGEPLHRRDFSLLVNFVTFKDILP